MKTSAYSNEILILQAVMLGFISVCAFMFPNRADAQTCLNAPAPLVSTSSVPSGPSTPETKAAATAILRLVMDVLVNQSDVSVVRVPHKAFDEVVQELKNHNVKTLSSGAARPAEAKVVFLLKSSTSVFEQTMYID